jgi:hypothetical protein
MRGHVSDFPPASSDPEGCERHWLQRMAAVGVCDTTTNSFKRGIASLRRKPSAADVARIASEACAQTGTAAPFGEDAVVRPAELPPTHPMHRDDAPALSGRLDAAAEEQAYRRGYHQGARAMLDLVRRGAVLAELEEACGRLERWRRRPIQRIGCPPGAEEEFAGSDGQTSHRQCNDAARRKL